MRTKQSRPICLDSFERGQHFSTIQSKKKSSRRRPSSDKKALKEIKNYQKSTELLIPKVQFQRIVRDRIYYYKEDARIQTKALEALQEGCEAFITRLFEDAMLCAVHAKHITLLSEDLKLALKLKLEDNLQVNLG